MSAEFFDAAMYLLVGILLQIFINLYPMRPGDWHVFKWVAVVPPITLIKFEHGPYLLESHIVVFIATFLLVVLLVFRDRFMPRLVEASIVFVGTIFIYAVGVEFGWSSWPVVYISPMLVAIFVLLCLRVILPFFAKAILYGCFLAMVFCIGLLQFRFADFAVLLAGKGGDIPIANAIADGMMLTFLTSYFMYLCMLMPYSDRSVAWKRMFDPWKETLAEMVERFSDYQAHPLLAMYIVVLLALVLYGNASLQLVDHWLLINVLLVFHPVIIGAIERLMYSTSRGIFHWQPIIELPVSPEKPLPLKGKLLSNAEIDANRSEELTSRRNRGARHAKAGGRKK